MTPWSCIVAAVSMAVLVSACGPAAEVGTSPTDARSASLPAAPLTPPPGLETADRDGASESAPPVTGPAPVSARIKDRTPGERPLPVNVRIPALDVAAPVVPVGVEAGGQLEVLDDVVHVGWYRHGSAPGENGSAVLAAHVDTAAEGPGVFFELRTLRPGDTVDVVMTGGKMRRFAVDSVARYRKDELPTEALFARDGEARIALITCGGTFDRQAGRYRDNVVVTASSLP